jgi:aryl-alcohol dehydrogenase-like predicted oxidoreductase
VNMNQNRLRIEDMDVSKICLGTMYMGNRDSIDLSYKLLDKYVESGGNFIDTANIYSFWVEGFQGGESETLIGRWLQERNCRENVVVATKVGSGYQNTSKGLNTKQIITECEKSLRRIGIDTIDLYYAHADDFSTPIEETMEAFYRLVKAGKIRYIGASNYNSWRLEESNLVAEFNNYLKYSVLQQRYTYFQPRHAAHPDFNQVYLTEEMINICRSRNISILAYSVLLNGHYSNVKKELPKQYECAENVERKKILDYVASETNLTANQIVILWLLNHEPTIVPVIGVSTKQHITEAFDALRHKIDIELVHKLNFIN